MTKNKILALKYRPQEFKDLIGQEVMSQTITNAIELGKTPNASISLHRCHRISRKKQKTIQRARGKRNYTFKPEKPIFSRRS